MGLSLRGLERYAEDYFFESEFRSHSPHTIETRQGFVRNLLWFLRHSKHDACGPREIREFFIYLSREHPEGRWGIKRLTKPLRPISLRDYFINLRIMFKWFVDEGLIEESPMARLATPPRKSAPIQPFEIEHIEALLAAARASPVPKRDVAILTLLLDTGLRASECCDLRVEDVDLKSRSVRVKNGKGGKARTVYMGRNSAKAVWMHLRARGHDQGGDLEPDAHVFISTRGNRAGEKMTPSGLLQIFQRLGKAADLKAVRCSPHTCRHTYAISMLRAGASVFALRESLGHADLTMTQNHVHLAEADLAEQSRLYSPMDRIKSQKSR